MTTVAQWYRGKVAAFSKTFVVEEGRSEVPEALPSAVCGWLEPYVKYQVVA